MDREEILKISKPGDLFTQDESGCKYQYRKFAKYFHPDGTNSDEEVFEHITKLYNEALSLLEKKEWKKSNYLELKSDNGKTLQICYLTQIIFELGSAYVCRNHVIYVLDSNKEKYYLNYINRVNSIQYANDEMKNIFQKQIPDIQTYGKLSSGEYYIVIRKTKDVYPLGYVLSYFEEIPGKHLAWIISRLSSLCCFLEYNNLVQNGLDINSCFVSLKYHSIILLGGWWYTTKIKGSLIGTTREIFDLMPVKAKTEKIADKATDLESVKHIGRQLLKASTHQKIQQKTNIPTPIKDFLIRGSGSEAIDEMRVWDSALDNAYGVRTFIALDITEKQIYNK